MVSVSAETENVVSAAVSVTAVNEKVVSVGLYYQCFRFSDFDFFDLECHSFVQSQLRCFICKVYLSSIRT